MLGRARLQEYYQRVLREDMLTAFNWVAELRSLECSIVLQGAQTMSDEVKYRAACVLEILTGQRVIGKECDVMQEDPAQRTASEAQKREAERARSAFIQQAVQGTRKKNAPKPDPKALASELRKLGSGVKLHTNLHGVKIHYFLEKVREFYLPDIVGSFEGVQRHAWRPAAFGHDNNISKKGLVLHYQKAGGSKRDCYPSRYPVKSDENIREAISCYTLRSTDLLKFPDIEVHFEALGSVLGGTRTQNSDQALQLILRPTVQLHSPLGKDSLPGTPQIDNLRVMNYLLSQFFNSYLNRPHIGQ